METTIDQNTTTETPAAETLTVTETDIDALIASAEERGYLRGKNEILQQWLQQPAMLQNLATTKSESRHDEAPSDPADSFLCDLRPGIWD